MSAHPDLSTLPRRMRYAATILREAAARESAIAGEHQLAVYSADHLEWMADRWDSGGSSEPRQLSDCNCSGATADLGDGA